MSNITLTQLENNVQFEPPVPDKNPEPSMPTIDRHGRHKYIRTRQCYCSYDAKDECRFHSQSEKGWGKCPNEAKGLAEHKVPRQLWGLNPEFNKPLEVEESETTEASNEGEMIIAEVAEATTTVDVGIIFERNAA